MGPPSRAVKAAPDVTMKMPPKSSGNQRPFEAPRQDRGQPRGPGPSGRPGGPQKGNGAPEKVRVFPFITSLSVQKTVVDEAAKNAPDTIDAHAFGMATYNAVRYRAVYEPFIQEAIARDLQKEQAM